MKKTSKKVTPKASLKILKKPKLSTLKSKKAVPKTIKVKCNNQIYKTKSHTRIKELITIANVSMPYRIMAAHLDGRLVELNYRMTRDCEISFIDYSHVDASRMYRRGMCFVMLKAAQKIFPDNELILRFCISDGYYFSFENGMPVFSLKDLDHLRHEMNDIIKKKIPFERKKIPINEAIKIFSKKNMTDKIRLFKYLDKETTNVYDLDGYVNYFYGFLPPDSSYVNQFELIFKSPGFILRFPTSYYPDSIPPYHTQVKLTDVFHEYEHWAKMLKIKDIGSINEIIKRKEDSEMTQIAEAMHEKKIAAIADKITHNFHRLKVICVAGPSSSGKTTFTKRLGLHLKANGLKLVQISLDNYFLDRHQTPRDINGEHNFEVIEALDLELFNSHLQKLISGQEIELPRYDFSKGVKIPSGTKIKIDNDQLILIEGIHGLNDKLTYLVKQSQKFKIYISPINHLNFDNNNVVSNTDFRMIRRIVRDNFFRGYSAIRTLEMWPKVRLGERENIFVFLDDADVLFNSSLVYEMNALKPYAEKELRKITIDSVYYPEARRLLNLLSYFVDLNCAHEIPPTSIIREFIGGSALEY